LADKSPKCRRTVDRGWPFVEPTPESYCIVVDDQDGSLIFFPGTSNHQADLSADGPDWAGPATCPIINCHVPDRQPRRPPDPSLDHSHTRPPNPWRAGDWPPPEKHGKNPAAFPAANTTARGGKEKEKQKRRGASPSDCLYI
jgi:hypothetical protein